MNSKTTYEPILRPRLVANVGGLGRIVEGKAHFSGGLNQLELMGANLISLRDEAYVRLLTYKKAEIGKYSGTWTSAGLESIKGEFPILKLRSRLLNPKLAELTLEVSSKNRYFSTSSTREYEESHRQAEGDLNKDPRDRKVIILPSRSQFTLGLNESREIFEAIFKDQAEAYSPFLKKNVSKLLSKEPMPDPTRVFLVHPEIVDSQEGTLLTQISMGTLGTGSELDGGSRLFHNNYVIRGVCKVA